MNASFAFTVTATDGSARAGRIDTPHGPILTPAFIPVGTKATVKGVLPEQLVALGAQVVLANTYHLFLQPGAELVQKLGGLGAFMGWSGPTMTDSGGYQVFSLGAGFGKGVGKLGERESSGDRAPAVFDPRILEEHGKLALVDEDGVSFTSHIDGALHRFTPERSVEIQHALGADIFFAFDECTSPTADYAYQREAMHRTHRWADRSLAAHRQNLAARGSQAIYGIVQGGRHEDLRRESAATLGAMGFDGYGIGGSFSKEDLGGALTSALDTLPSAAPRHLLGIGDPRDILEGISRGVDTFDCVAATRLGRTGTAYTRTGTLDLTKAPSRGDETRLDPTGQSPYGSYTRGYLHHVFKAGEMIGPVIVSLHNLAFILSLVDGARSAIEQGRFVEYRESFLSVWRG